jgi:hypothetical protein
MSEFTLVDGYSIAAYIKEAKKQTPVKLYLNGQLEHIDFSKVKAFGDINSKVIFGDIEAIDAILKTNANNIKDYVLENMESEMIDNVKNEIIQSISKEDLMFLGKMYSELGPEEFKDITQDVIENEDSQSELSEISFKVKIVIKIKIS